MSVYSVRSSSRFDLGHAMGVVASTIGSDDYKQRKREQYDAKLSAVKSPHTTRSAVSDDAGAKVATFIIPASLVVPSTMTYTPANNLAFGPASTRHFDVRVKDPANLAVSLLEGIRSGEVVYTFLTKPHYRSQAAIVLSWCIEQDPSLRGWKDGGSLSAHEQQERLRYLAGDQGFLSRA